jgi:hypothetical protein
MRFLTGAKTGFQLLYFNQQLKSCYFTPSVLQAVITFPNSTDLVLISLRKDRYSGATQDFSPKVNQYFP